MMLIISVITFLFSMTLLVAFHEYGHFIIARFLGIKVLRFSIGFGKALWRWRDKRGTEYVFAMIPLGGYVKMLDEREAPVPPAERHLAFNRQSVWKRIAVIAAGPLFNLGMAVLIYWCVAVIGTKDLIPMIGRLTPGSLAEKLHIPVQAEILSIDGKPTPTWMSVRMALLSRVGESGYVDMRLKKTGERVEQVIHIPLSAWPVDPKLPQPLESLGVLPMLPKIPLIVGAVHPEQAAARAGLQVGDTVLAVEGKALETWQDFIEVVRASPERTLHLSVSREHQTLKLAVMPDAKKSPTGQMIGFIGVESKQIHWPPSAMRSFRYGAWSAFPVALRKMQETTTLTLQMIGKLFQGRVSLQSLSGPVGIAEGAGQSAMMGLTYFLSFLGLLNVSLGVLNLLPIPLLDGGQLVYCFAEILMRRPVSLRIQMMGFRLSVFLLITLMLIALVNDIARLLG